MLEALGRDAADNPAHRRRSRQRNRANVGMLGDRSTYVRTESAHDVDDALGQARVAEGANQIKGRERRVLRGLNDASVAANDRRQKLPRRNRHGKVPRRDHAAHADGLAHGHGELVGHFRRNGGAEQPAPFAGVVIGGVNGFLHVAAGLGQHLAHFAGHLAGILFLALDQDLGGAENDLGAARSRHQSPLGEGALGGGDGGVHVRFGGFLEDADQIAGVGGIAIFEGLSGRGLDPLAVNEILENLGLAVAERGGLVKVSVAMMSPEILNS